jgi:hypothetical protein
MWPDASRARFAVATVFSFGFAAGLIIPLHGFVSVHTGALLVPYAVVAAWLTWSQRELPHSVQGRRVWTEHPFGLIPISLAGVAAGQWAVPKALSLLVWMALQPGFANTMKTVVAALVVAAPFVARYVWNRHILNRARGKDVRPRVLAFWAASLAFVITAINNVLQLSTLPELKVLFQEWGIAVAFAAAFLGSIVQRRVVAGERFWFAVQSGVWGAVAAAWFTPGLAITSVPHDWGDYFSGSLWLWLGLVGSAAFIGDYLVAGYGNLRGRGYR